MGRAYLAFACAIFVAALTPMPAGAGAQLPEGLYETVMAVQFDVSLDGSAGIMNTKLPPATAASPGTCSGVGDPTWVVPFAWVDRNLMEQGQPRLESRTLADMVLVHEAKVTWYLVQPDTAVPKPGTLRVTLFDGQHPSMAGSLEDRRVLAEGSVQVNLKSGPNRIEVPLPGSHAVWEKKTEPTLQVVFDSIVGCADRSPPVATSSTEMLSSLTLHSDATVHIDFLHPEVAAGILLIHTAARSPWGTGDLDLANITLDIDGPMLPGELQLATSSNRALHGHPAEVTWLWRFRDEAAPTGMYNLTVTVRNHAQTQEATAGAHFVVEAKTAYGIDDRGRVVAGHPTQAAPLTLLPSILSLAAAAWTRRSRP